MRIKGGTHRHRINLGSPPQYTNYLFHALAFCAGVVVAVTFKKVDDAPNAETCTESDNESLKYAYCACEKFHK